MPPRFNSAKYSFLDSPRSSTELARETKVEHPTEKIHVLHSSFKEEFHDTNHEVIEKCPQKMNMTSGDCCGQIEKDLLSNPLDRVSNGAASSSPLSLNRDVSSMSLLPMVKTFVRAKAPVELIDASGGCNARGLSVAMTLHSVVYCGGGVLKGRLVLDYNHKSRKNQDTQVVAISLDCVGVEHVKGYPPKMFFTIAQELVANGYYLSHLQSAFPTDEGAPHGRIFVPFEVQLPLDVGPGTFISKEANVEYTIFGRICISNQKRFPDGKNILVSRKVKLFPCLNPHVALVPSVEPIDTSEEGKLMFGGRGTLKVAARIHRPSWISGQSAFVDISATNDTHRDISKIVLTLIRHVVFYKNSAASSNFQAVDLRVPDRVQTKVISTNALATGNEKTDYAGWKGIKSGTRDTVVCQIQVPSDELSVSAGRYFETKYFINVSVGCKTGEVVVELPITIIHINSLDVMPDSLSSVERMIAEYTDSSEPFMAPSKARSHLQHQRRGSTASVFGNATLETLLEDSNDESHVLQPISGTDFRRNPDIHGGVPCELPSKAHRRSMTMDTEKSLTSLISLGTQQYTNTAGVQVPKIQTDLRRALSLDYQGRYRKLDISTEQCNYTGGALLSDRSPDRKKQDEFENLGHRLIRERSLNMNFYDVL